MPFLSKIKTKYMSLSKIKSMYDIVKILLQKNEDLRDDDNLLVSKIWAYTLVDMGYKPSEQNITLFLNFYSTNQLPQADMITRARRKVQQECADLRGEKYEERHKEEKNVRDNINGFGLGEVAEHKS